ncbi:MAG: aminotransferase class V-fold PLP-dependent enzyme [Polaribacter sp.]|uniref:aminotransferase class V-fold PLP-dependent enzyme n=1 Tax=Polaribacter sp. TaxID=1920175 RepID=UPI0032647D08
MNIEDIRNDILNYNDKLFFNSASSSLPATSVVKKITDYLIEEQQIGGYKIEEERSEDINGFYVQSSKLLGCKPNNIAFAYNSTDAYSKALLSIDFKKNDVIITSDDDYVSNHFQFIALQKRIGVKIIRIKTLVNGDLDIHNFKELVAKYHPKLVAVTHVPTNSGLVQDVVTIGGICSQNNILFLLDACQSVGQLVVDVKKIKCDFLVVTGRKWLRGPRGTGILYVSNNVLDQGLYPLTIDGNGALWNKEDDFEIFKTAKRFELFESSRALVVGFAEALRYLNAIGIEQVESTNKNLITKLRTNLNDIKGVKIFDKGSVTSSILTFRKEGKSLEEIKTKFQKNNVFYSVSAKPWGFIDFEKKDIDWVIRLSPHYFNTEKEINKVSEIIESI